MTIYPIEEKDIPFICDIASECFVDDPFYLSLHPERDNRILMIESIFDTSIRICQEYGHAYYQKDTTENTYVAFALWFDYHKLRKQSPEGFNHIFAYEDKDLYPQNIIRPELSEEIDKVINKSREYLYLLAVAVDKKHREKKRATNLVKYVCDTYPLHCLFSDISNEDSLKVYIKDLGFTQLGKEDNNAKDKCIYVRRLSTQTSKNFPKTKKINLVIPKDFDYSMIWERKKIESREIISPQTGINYRDINIPYFSYSLYTSAEAQLVEITYGELMSYQRYINTLLFDEIVIEIDGTPSVIYKTNKQHDEGLILQDTKTQELIVSKKQEWDVIPDMYVSIPVKYSCNNEYRTKIEEKHNSLNDFNINRIMTAMYFRTRYEAGLPTQNPKEFRNRIKRRFLGYLDIQLYNESEVDYSKNSDYRDQCLGEPVSVALILAFDDMSESGVLHIVSLASGFVITQFLDSLSRNEITIVCQGDDMNLYEFLKEEYGIEKKSSPKTFLTIPQNRNEIKANLLSALLFCETLYEDEKGLGTIADKTILGIVNDVHGDGQYDYAHAFSHTNILVQISSYFQNDLYSRIARETVTLLYIELVLFEEAALCIASDNIVAYLTKTHDEDHSARKDLETIHHIALQHARTIEFWNIQMSYPSTTKSMNMIRDKFLIQDVRERHKRNQEELIMIYETRSGIEENKASEILNITALALAVVSVMSFLFLVLSSDESPNSKCSVLVFLPILSFIILRYFKKSTRIKSNDTI